MMPGHRPLGIKLHKVSKELRIGISFQKDEERTLPPDTAGAVVSGLHPYGIATQAGLAVDDVVLSINGRPMYTSLAAAAALRDSEGDIWMSVHRPLAFARLEHQVGDSDGEEEKEELDGPVGREQRPRAVGGARPKLPPLRVGDARAHQQYMQSRQQQQAAAGGEEEAEGSFDIGQMTARALSGFHTLLTGERLSEPNPPSASASSCSRLSPAGGGA